MMIQNTHPEFENRERLLREARIMVAKLERISADSIWAHRSSGVRGNLLKLAERIEANLLEARRYPADPPFGGGHHRPLARDLADLEHLLAWSFDLLVRAAKEKIE
jgi:hypothetical protein